MSITAANAGITLSIQTLFPTPIPLIGFAADEVFDTEEIESVEVMMGVDGKLSAGFVNVPAKFHFTLQADSPSNDVFDTWWLSMQKSKDTYAANGVIILPAISRKWIMMNGHLTNYKPTPSAKKLLQPRKYTITFETLEFSPV